MCSHQGKFKFLLKAKRVSIPVVVPEQYYCEMSGQNYCGTCQIETCPANLPGHKHLSGCLYLFYERRKKEFDKYDIMYALDVKERAYKSLYDSGHAAATNIVMFYKIVAMLRTRNVKPQCSCCGIYLDTPGDCANKSACTQRKNIMKNIIAQSNLRYPEFRAVPRDVYTLLMFRTDVDQYLREQQNANLSNLCHLFGLNPKTYDTLVNISLHNKD